MVITVLPLPLVDGTMKVMMIIEWQVVRRMAAY